MEPIHIHLPSAARHAGHAPRSMVAEESIVDILFGLPSADGVADAVELGSMRRLERLLADRIRNRIRERVAA